MKSHTAEERRHGKARLQPRWFVVTFWHMHRLIVRASRGRKGLWPPRPGKWGRAAAYHDWPAQRRAAERHHRLLRGWP
jgi:hypothetical protein